MSVVVGFSFPDEAIIISDSRISYVDNRVIVGTKDILQKIFPLTPYLAVGFTSNDVKITYKILHKLEEYVKNQAKAFTYPLLEKLPKVASYEYKKLVKSKSMPEMEFVYTGLLSDRTLRLPEPYVMDLLFRNGGGAVPESIGRAFMTMQDGYMYIDPPTPVVMTQSFPSGEISPMRIWGFLASGSGKPIEEKLFIKEYPTLFHTSSDIDMRSNMIRLHCDAYIKNSGIPTIGGGIQVLRLNAKGVKPVTLSLKSIDTTGKTKDLQSMEFTGKEWIYKNYETGKEDKIKISRFDIDEQLAMMKF